MNPHIEKLLSVCREATRSRWHAGHLCRDDHTCNCRYVLCEKYMGAICTVHVDNGKSVYDGGTDDPPLHEAKGNQRHITTFQPKNVERLLVAIGNLIGQIEQEELVVPFTVAVVADEVKEILEQLAKEVE